MGDDGWVVDLYNGLVCYVLFYNVLIIDRPQSNGLIRNTLVPQYLVPQQTPILTPVHQSSMVSTAASASIPIPIPSTTVQTSQQTTSQSSGDTAARTLSFRPPVREDSSLLPESNFDDTLGPSRSRHRGGRRAREKGNNSGSLPPNKIETSGSKRGSEHSELVDIPVFSTSYAVS